jgi:hypothetical protein
MRVCAAWIPISFLMVLLPWVACSPAEEAPLPCDLEQVVFQASCVPLECEPPRAPTVSPVHSGVELWFETSSIHPIQVGSSLNPNAEQPEAWVDADRVALPEVEQSQKVKVFARLHAPACLSGPWFEFVYEVRPAYPGAAGSEGSQAVALDDPAIVGWADAWVDPVDWGEALDAEWKDPNMALGPAEGTVFEVVSLGAGGSLILSFDPPIADGPGFDFAVFEIAVNDSFLELAFIEVSSDGQTFVSFDGVQLAGQPVDAFGSLEASDLGGLAGKLRRGFGQPFDLAALAFRPEVFSGSLDLSAVRYVRVVDVIGDGSQTDSFGNPLYDPYPTTGSAGFDLDAIGVLNTAD